MKLFSEDGSKARSAAHRVARPKVQRRLFTHRSLLAAVLFAAGCSPSAERSPGDAGGRVSSSAGAGNDTSAGGSSGAPGAATGGIPMPGAAGATGGAAPGAAGQVSASGAGPLGEGGRNAGTAGARATTPPPGIGGFAALVPPSAITTTDPSCGVQSFKRERKPAEVILVLDRSASMQDSPEGSTMEKWDIVEPAVTSIIGSTNASISWGLKLYPESQDTDACAPESIVPLIHVPIAANNATAVVGAITATDPEGDGTPTGDAIKFATAHLRQRANENPKYILLATDGDPSCPEDGDAIAYAVQAITEALTAGYPTFVVGVDTSKESSIERLNAMAVAGGRSRPPQLLNPILFYLASTQADLSTALQTITGEVASCVFELNPPPPVPDNIAVDFSGQRTARDPSRLNGWEYTSPDHTSLEVYGSFCERIKREAMNQVEIKYGCPNQPIPVPS